MATNAQNPYIQEIYDESMRTTQNLGVSKVFLLDVTPETAYARMIARYCIGRDDAEEQISIACKTIQASKESTGIIQEKALAQIANSEGLQSKPFESWDLIPIQVTACERELHKRALTEAHQRFGLEYQVVDAEGSIESVVTTIKQSIK